MAQLPDEFIKLKDPRLKDIAVGETVYVEFTALAVTPDRTCFLRPTAHYELERNIFFYLQVLRDEDGYHVTILSDLVTWKPDSPDIVEGWIPIKTVKVELDPDLQRPRKRKK